MRHTIVAVDVEGFGGRGFWHQRVVREGLSTAVRDAFDHCGIAWEECHREDRGDGLLVLAPTDVRNSRLVECLPNELAARLREHNAAADAGANIRLRIVVHSGEVEGDSQGVSGPAVVFAFRLLNAAALKDALARSRGVIAMITSEEFFREVIANHPGANPGIYRQVRVSEKETNTTAWMCLPDNHVASGGAAGHVARRESGRHRRKGRGRRRLPPVRPHAVILVLLLAGGLVSDALAAAPPPRSCAEPVQLNLSVSVEKAPVIQKLVPTFEKRSWRRDGGLRCKEVNVQVTVARSSDSVTGALGRSWLGSNDVRDVGPEPHVLLPDSSWEVKVARAALDRNRRTDVTLDVWGSIATSPLVIAKPMRGGVSSADQLGGWADVLAMAERLPFGEGEILRPSPVSSGTGLVATIALYSAMLGPDLNAAVLTATDAPARLHEVERSIPAGEDQSGMMLCSLRQRMDSVPHTTVLVSEKAAGDYNRDELGASCPPAEHPDSLDVLYPKGTLSLDHPFVVVNWNTRPVNERRRQAIQNLFDFLVGRDAQADLRRARFRDRAGDIDPFTGVMPDRPTELSIGSVDVDALLQAFDNARKSARALFLVDVSASMAERFLDVGGNRLAAASDAVSRTLRSIGDRDEVGLWETAGGLAGALDYRIAVPAGRPTDVLNGRSRAEVIQESLQALRAGPQPARLYGPLRDAVASLRDSADAGAETRDAVVVIADGTAREQGHTELVSYLRSGNRSVPVFMIAFGTSVCSSPHWQEITASTGGACQEVSVIADIGTALDGVAARLWGG